jgi:hypothetical protein
MAEDLIGYNHLVETALRQVVQDVVRRVAERGLPGEHHFYLTFRTDHPDVELSPALRARYPNEMTVVLQHQFWDLVVDDEGFAVSLSFSGVSERLRVGWSAVKVFADPTVEFGLQFSVPEPDADAPDAKQADTASDRQADAGSAEVVTLDRFRKK